MAEDGEHIAPIWEFDSLTTTHNHAHVSRGAYLPPSLDVETYNVGLANYSLIDLLTFF